MICASWKNAGQIIFFRWDWKLTRKVVSCCRSDFDQQIKGYLPFIFILEILFVMLLRMFLEVGLKDEFDPCRGVTGLGTNAKWKGSIPTMHPQVNNRINKYVASCKEYNKISRKSWLASFWRQFHDNSKEERSTFFVAFQLIFVPHHRRKTHAFDRFFWWMMIKV